jgi:hypothetical protein
VQVSLEERAHLRIARTRTVENQEMDLETKQINVEGEDDEAQDAGDPMPKIRFLKE